MTLLLGEVAALLGAAAIWLAAAVALALLGAVVVAAPARRHPRPIAMRVAVIAGLVAAGLAGRFSAPDPLEFNLMRRPLPVSWLLGGAIAGAATVIFRRGDRGEAPAASPVADAGPR